MREIKLKNITWLSITTPNRADINELKERFPKIHPLILEELLTSTIRPRVENYDHTLFMVLHFPDFDEQTRQTSSHEINFILLPNTIITVQYNELNLLEDFWHQNQDDAIEELYSKTPVHFLYYLLRGYFAYLAKEIDQIQLELDKIEEKVFADKQKEALEEISLLRKSILDFRRAIKPQHVTLQSLVAQGQAIYGEKIKPYLQDLVGEYLKVWNLMENHKEILDALYETNNSLLNVKTNEAIRALSLLAFMTFIPMTVAAILSIRASGTPLLERENGFLIIIGIIAGLMLIFYSIFKRRKFI